MSDEEIKSVLIQKARERGLSGDLICDKAIWGDYIITNIDESYFIYKQAPSGIWYIDCWYKTEPTAEPLPTSFQEQVLAEFRALHKEIEKLQRKISKLTQLVEGC